MKVYPHTTEGQISENTYFYICCRNLPNVWPLQGVLHLMHTQSAV